MQLYSSSQQWCHAKAVDVDPKTQRIKLHCPGFSKATDEWLPSSRCDDWVPDSGCLDALVMPGVEKRLEVWFYLEEQPQLQQQLAHCQRQAARKMAARQKDADRQVKAAVKDLIREVVLHTQQLKRTRLPKAAAVTSPRVRRPKRVMVSGAAALLTPTFHSCTVGGTGVRFLNRNMRQGCRTPLSALGRRAAQLAIVPWRRCDDWVGPPRGSGHTALVIPTIEVNLAEAHQQWLQHKVHHGHKVAKLRGSSGRVAKLKPVLQVLHSLVWYPARVLLVDPQDRKIKIHFRGWSKSNDEWLPVDSDRIRFVSQSVLKTVQAAVNRMVRCIEQSVAGEQCGLVECRYRVRGCLSLLKNKESEASHASRSCKFKPLEAAKAGPRSVLPGDASGAAGNTEYLQAASASLSRGEGDEPVAVDTDVRPQTAVDCVDRRAAASRKVQMRSIEAVLNRLRELGPSTAERSNTGGCRPPPPQDDFADRRCCSNSQCSDHR